MKGNGFTKKIALVGTGAVGMSFAYAAVCTGVCDELALIDINRQKANGEAMDLNHGLAFAKSNMRIYAAGYEACADADIVVFAAGAAQKPDESRRALLHRNILILRSSVAAVLDAGFTGIFLVATNPVDILTRYACQITQLDAKKVIGSGTTLDTARLRYLLGEYFSVDPKNVHAYVIGEHGDSELVPWSQAYIGTKPILEIVKAYPTRFSTADLEKIAHEVKNAAYEIIAAKGATCYGIGLSLARIVKAVFSGENSILTVSARWNGAYGQQDIYAGVPCIIGRNGVREILTLPLSETEKEQLAASCELLETDWHTICKTDYASLST